MAMQQDDAFDSADADLEEERRWNPVRSGLRLLSIAWASAGLLMILCGAAVFLLAGRPDSAPQFFTFREASFASYGVVLGGILAALAAISYFLGYAFCAAAPSRGVRILASVTVLFLICLAFGGACVATLPDSRKPWERLGRDPLLLMIAIVLFVLNLFQLGFGGLAHAAIARSHGRDDLRRAFKLLAVGVPIVVVITLVVSWVLRSPDASSEPKELLLSALVEMAGFALPAVWYLVLNGQLRRQLGPQVQGN